jgi:branched-subunit amino acid ABC-type transport system permease component
MDILPQLIVNSIIAGSIYAVVALGFNLIYGTVKFFDIGFGAITAVGGYSVFFFYKKLGFELFTSVFFGVIIAGAIGYLIYRLVYSPLRARKAKNMVMLVASLGSFIIVQAMVAMIFTSQFQTLSRSVGTQRIYDIGGGVITETQLVILITAFVIMLLLSLFVEHTRNGKAIQAVADDEEVAKVVGVNTNKLIGLVFFIGSAIAGLAGILVGFDTGIEPTMGMALLLKGVVAAIIGGIGNIYGGVAGAFLLGFVENFGIWKISGEWKDAIAFGLLIVFLLFRPQGIFKR